MTDKKKTPTNKSTLNHEQPSGQLDIVAIELRRARELKGLSHSDLHRQTGISRPVLFGYENGRTKPGAKELRLLSEALGVSPNRLLFGVEEPFKPQAGIRSLVKLRNSPVSMLLGMFLIPTALAVLDDDQVESLLTIISSMVESRDKDTHKKISKVIEILSQELGNGTPEDISNFSTRAKDPAYLEILRNKVEAEL
jgi:transcriptional regulator with XRE-family HTH domain